ncbi:hypothetical protein FB451DRAFT_1399377 [Mycena latifolia]|nr:hypothetical protein FB451DRAFT_1399377 [Mycena latifolia]
MSLGMFMTALGMQAPSGNKEAGDTWETVFGGLFRDYSYNTVMEWIFSAFGPLIRACLNALFPEVQESKRKALEDLEVDVRYAKRARCGSSSTGTITTLTDIPQTRHDILFTTPVAAPIFIGFLNRLALAAGHTDVLLGLGGSYLAEMLSCPPRHGPTETQLASCNINDSLAGHLPPFGQTSVLETINTNPPLQSGKHDERTLQGKENTAPRVDRHRPSNRSSDDRNRRSHRQHPNSTRTKTGRITTATTGMTAAGGIIHHEEPTVDTIPIRYLEFIAI